VIHDGSEEVLAGFPVTTSGKPGIMRKGINDGAAYGAESRPPGTPMSGFGDSGSAARFYYCAKASKAEREAGLSAPAGKRANVHPTVKPVALMKYLLRLVLPPGGIALDPFAGSGTTLVAAAELGMTAIGIERDPAYVEIAAARVQAAEARAARGDADTDADTDEEGEE
jgi:site-specific DNA-methyltransferase (adenine-specific)